MAPQRGFKTDRWFHVSDAKDQMDVVRQSDGSVVSTKSANKDATEASAEWMEKRDPAKRNADQANPPQAQNWDKVGKSGLERVREAARKDGKMKFVSLLHHADVDALRRSFYQLKKTAVVGIDGITWQDYEHDLEVKLIDLHGRIHRGSYQAKPSRRVWIPKPDGRQRPLGITSIEDKIVQRTVCEILQNIYEEDLPI